MKTVKNFRIISWRPCNNSYYVSISPTLSRSAK